MRNIKLTLQYDGTNFQGWQSQSQGERTVQDVLAGAVRKITGEDATVIGAGRTDSGVHALGQVAAFRTLAKLDMPTMQRALNAVLPSDLRVMDATEMDDDFHPQYSAISKRYVYLIANVEHSSPFIARYAWHVKRRLDIAAMEAAGKHLEGEHDFRGFMAAGSAVKTTVRKLTSLSIVEASEVPFLGFRLLGRFLRIEAEGTGFLRHMVRNIAGTLVEIGKGRMEAGFVRDIVASGERGLAGPTAPAQGLFLERVGYQP